VPLIAFDQHDPLVEIFRDNQNLALHVKVDNVTKIIHTLDVYHLSNLKTVVKHLSKIASQSHANKMSSLNLGTIFGQCLLRAPTEDMSKPLKSHLSLVDMKYQNECVSFLVENYEHIFEWDSI